MALFFKPVRPYIVWRNPAMPHWTREAKYYQSGLQGDQYEVLERANGYSGFVRVAVLTVISGGRSTVRQLPASKIISA